MTKYQTRFRYGSAAVAVLWLLIVICVMIWQYVHLPGDTYVIWIPGLIKFGVLPAVSIIVIGWLAGRQPENR